MMKWNLLSSSRWVFFPYSVLKCPLVNVFRFKKLRNKLERFSKSWREFWKEIGTAVGPGGISPLFQRDLNIVLLKSILSPFLCAHSRGVLGRFVPEAGRFHPQSTHQRSLASLPAARLREQPAQPDAGNPREARDSASHSSRCRETPASTRFAPERF